MRKISVVLIAIMAFILTACATPAGAATQANSTQAAGGTNQNTNAPLPLASQLALGTINLKETSYAVTADQAATLLPLWEGLKSLSSSTSFSQQEYDALVKQIQDSMNPEQVKAITDMKLTQADIGKTMQALGLANGFGRGLNANGTPITRTPGTRPGGTGGNGGGTRGGGDFPSGGFGGIPGGAGGGNRQGGFNATPATQATIEARQAQRANQSNVFLDTAVITFLQQLTGTTPVTGATPTPTS